MKKSSQTRLTAAAPRIFRAVATAAGEKSSAVTGQPSSARCGRLPGAAAAGNQRVERRRLAGDEIGKGGRHLAGIPRRDALAEALAPEIGVLRALIVGFDLGGRRRRIAHAKIAAFETLAACRSMSAPSKIIIASRESRLAMWQAVHVQGRLASLNPGAEVVILGMTTKGDQILDRPLAEIGGKGLFIKELEVAMEEGRAHLAVHSMKDVPMVMPEGFVLAAISARENPRDAFVSNKYAGLDELPAGAVVGTSSLRRESILRAKYPQLVIKSLRGNLDTRLRKLDAGEYDAIILAAAGLIRLGLENRIKSVLTAEQSLPAPGPGRARHRTGRRRCGDGRRRRAAERPRNRPLRQGRARFLAGLGRQLPGAARRLRDHRRRPALAARLRRHRRRQGNGRRRTARRSRQSPATTRRSAASWPKRCAPRAPTPSWRSSRTANLPDDEPDRPACRKNHRRHPAAGAGRAAGRSHRRAGRHSR